MRQNTNSLLNDDLTMRISADSALPPLNDVWRAKIDIIDEKRGEHVSFGNEKKFLTYELWATSEYLEDVAKVPSTKNGMREFAKEYFKKRFEEAVDQNGDRSLEEIAENCAVCRAGVCAKGERWDFSKL